MKVSHILKKRRGNYYSIGPDQPLQDAVDLMMAQRIGSLIVMDDGKMLSIVTERDVMRAAHEHRAEFFTTKVRAVMAPTLVICKDGCSLDEAMALMFKNATGRRIRHLPVVSDGDELLGVVSIGDIVEALLTEVQFENQLLKNYIKNWPEEG